MSRFHLDAAPSISMGSHFLEFQVWYSLVVYGESKLPRQIRWEAFYAG